MEEIKKTLKRLLAVTQYGVSRRLLYEELELGIPSSRLNCKIYANLAMLE